jgi:hypothetical protein
VVGYTLAGYHNLEETLADLFGLNDSKYQWAIDEYFQQEEEVRIATVEGQSTRVAFVDTSSVVSV